MIIHKHNYSCAGWTPEQWGRSLPRILHELGDHIDATGAQAVVVRGSSGLLYAGRLLDQIDIPFIMVRKPNELSHGMPCRSSAAMTPLKSLSTSSWMTWWRQAVRRRL